MPQAWALVLWFQLGLLMEDGCIGKWFVKRTMYCCSGDVVKLNDFGNISLSLPSKAIKGMQKGLFHHSQSKTVTGVKSLLEIFPTWKIWFPLKKKSPSLPSKAIKRTRKEGFSSFTIANCDKHQDITGKISCLEIWFPLKNKKKKANYVSLKQTK